ncbi:PH, RCC1 and FYVE domains-containing protein 1-like isoform X2 [Wolffia australiana]
MDEEESPSSALSGFQMMSLNCSGSLEKRRSNLSLVRCQRLFLGSVRQYSSATLDLKRSTNHFLSYTTIDLWTWWICKDKEEAEVWFVGLKALISHGSTRNWRNDMKSDRPSSDSNSPQTFPQRTGNPDPLFNGLINAQQIHKTSGIGKVLSNVILYTMPGMSSLVSDSANHSYSSVSDNMNGRGSTAEGFRVSLSSAISSSNGSCHDDFDAMGVVLIWGEGAAEGILGGGAREKMENTATRKIDAYLPKPLDTAVVLDVQSMACGGGHAVLVTKQGEVFSWGEEAGGRLGHGVDADLSRPKFISSLSGLNVGVVACGEHHTCVLTMSGDLYTWGDGVQSTGNSVSHWVPRKVGGPLEGLHVSSVSCGPWNTAMVTSSGRLFTVGDGTFGCLGHGDRESLNSPREVEGLKGLWTVKAACGAWHMAAIVDISTDLSRRCVSSSGKLFTWGDGDRNRLGHGDRKPRLVPERVASVIDLSFCQVACGNDMTVALEASGRVYTMGSSLYGQLGSPDADGRFPGCVGGKLTDLFVEEIACGSHHVAVLTSRTEVYTWGKGSSGCLGHGDCGNRNSPTLVEALKDKQVRSVVCGSNFTAAIFLHKWVSGADHSVCSGCHLPFGFRRKRHNCYNCGLVFCKACSSRKSFKASLAPSIGKPYRVCDDCFTKLKKHVEVGPGSRFLKAMVPSKSQGHLSRLSSIESFKSSDSRVSKNKGDANAFANSPSNGNFLWGNLNSSRTPSSFIFGSSVKVFSASVPSSRIASRASSPISRKPSPPPVAEVFDGVTSPFDSFEKSKMTQENENREVLALKLQVEELTRKSEFLENELEKVTKQLHEATSTAREESARCKAAKEVIRSLTTQKHQLKDVGEAQQSDSSQSVSSVPRLPPKINTSPVVQSSELAARSDGSPSCNGNMACKDESEWVEQAEPGVYITVSAHPSGGKYLKRVRFSRKKFREEQAERWWAENRLKIQDKYIFPSQEKMNSLPLSDSADSSR